jgi:hypothetical protein
VLFRSKPLASFVIKVRAFCNAVAATIASGVLILCSFLISIVCSTISSESPNIT